MRLHSFLLVGVLLLPSPATGQENATRETTTKQAESSEFVIDINRASVEEFTKLPGVGPALARRIVAFREKHGPFRRVEDLLAIRGIGHKKWKAIRPHLAIGEFSNKKQKAEGRRQKAEG